MRANLLCMTFVLATARNVSADDGSGETIIIVGRAPGDPAADRDRALDDAPFVTIVHPDDHPAAQSVADALAASAGVQTRSLGGLGAYESVSVRGNVPGQTEVLIDGIPLARLAAGDDRPRPVRARQLRPGRAVSRRGAGRARRRRRRRRDRPDHAARPRTMTARRCARRSAPARSARATCARTTAMPTPAGAGCRRSWSAIRARPATSRTTRRTTRSSTRTTTRLRSAATTRSISSTRRRASDAPIAR